MRDEELVGWHHCFSGHGFEQTLGDSGGQGNWCVAARGVANSWMQLSHYNNEKPTGM